VTQEFRVLIVTNAYSPRIGGISAYLENLVRGLEGRGIRTSVSAMPESFNRLDEAAKGHALWWRTIHLFFVAAFVIKSVGSIIGLRLEGSSLIVHSHSASYCLVVGLVAKLLGSTAVHTFHSPLEKPSAVLQTFAARCDALVFVSQALFELYAAFGIWNSNTFLIPGGVDTERFRPPSQHERQLARISIGEYFDGSQVKGEVILFVGRVTKEKGVDYLLEASEDVFRTLPEARLLVIGPYSTNPEGRAFLVRCMELAGRGFLTGRVAMPGEITERALLSCYWGADLLVCPSTWEEPASIVVAEGSACGLPVVASHVGGLAERIDHDVTGLLVPAKDPQGLAGGILGVLSNRPRAEAMGRNGRLKASRELSMDRTTDFHVNLYTSLLTNAVENEGIAGEKSR